jgi:hypothetical protein
MSSKPCISLSLFPLAFRSVQKFTYFFNSTVFLVLIVFLYAISSFICTHLLSKQCSVFLCVCLHFSNGMCNSADKRNDEDCSLLGYYDKLTGNLLVHFGETSLYKVPL